MKAERERSRTEMKDLQQQLSEMHDELDQAKRAEVTNTEKEVLLKVNETRCRGDASQISSRCKASAPDSRSLTLNSDGFVSGFGAAACGLPGDAPGEGGAGGGAALPGDGAQ